MKLSETHTYSFKTALCQNNPGKPVPDGQTILDFTEAEMMGWQRHQLDHMQVICTSLQTDNHTSTSSLSFYRPNALPVVCFFLMFLQFRDFSNVPPLDAIMSDTSMPDAQYANQMPAPSLSYTVGMR